MSETNLNEQQLPNNDETKLERLLRRRAKAKHELTRLEERAIQLQTRRFLERDLCFRALQVRRMQINQKLHRLRCSISKKVLGIGKRKVALQRMQNELRSARRKEKNQVAQKEKVCGKIESIQVEANRIAKIRTSRVLGVARPLGETPLSDTPTAESPEA